MRTNDPGHRFYLDNYSGTKAKLPTYGYGQELVFMKRIGENYPNNTGAPYDGTNCQEVLRALIARLKYLNRQIPCPENEASLDHLRQVLFMFELRAARIKGKLLPADISINHIEDFPACRICGHIYIHDFESTD